MGWRQLSKTSLKENVIGAIDVRSSLRVAASLQLLVIVIVIVQAVTWGIIDLASRVRKKPQNFLHYVFARFAMYPHDQKRAAQI